MPLAGSLAPRPPGAALLLLQCPRAPVPGHPLLQLLMMNCTQPPAARALWHPSNGTTKRQETGGVQLPAQDGDKRLPLHTRAAPSFTEHKPCVPAGKSKSGHIGIHKTKGSKGSTLSKSLRNTLKAEMGFSSTPVTAARVLPGSRERPPKRDNAFLQMTGNRALLSPTSRENEAHRNT